jgi:hypothetical protein
LAAYKYVYWFEGKHLSWVRETLAQIGLEIKRAKLTPCQALRASAGTVYIAAPQIFNGLCKRQVAWYRHSHRCGQYLLVSAERLPQDFETFLESWYSESDFSPPSCPSDEEIKELVASPEYQENKPRDRELIGLKDAILQKLLFTVTGLWRQSDNFNKFRPKQCTTHANFILHRFTTKYDGEEVPYTVKDSLGVCSSCMETFNLVDRDSRKLVAPCPGAVKFGVAKQDVFLDVEPAKPSKQP